MRTIQWGAAIGLALVLAGACGGRTETDAGATGGSGGVIGTGGTAGYGGANAGAFVPANAQSCAGALTCNGESCCTSINVPGGTFPQGRSTVVGASDYFADAQSDETPEFSSTVSSFALDKYEVTVGRFRKYVDAYVDNVTSAPAQGAGANPAIPGSGWQSAWNWSLAPTEATLRAMLDSPNTTYDTWTNSPGTTAQESRAINMVEWAQAFAFCIWDGGRLPTESEREYAAAGGAENRLYPWGSAEPTCRYANFFPGAPCRPDAPGGFGEVAPVGSFPAGNGKWGHADLAGNVEEWALDVYGTYQAGSRTDYANTSNAFAPRIVRGGSLNSFTVYYLRAAYRTAWYPNNMSTAFGLRCARAVQ
jgi:sulfatase modifying factor 1